MSHFVGTSNAAGSSAPSHEFNRTDLHGTYYRIRLHLTVHYSVSKQCRISGGHYVSLKYLVAMHLEAPVGDQEILNETVLYLVDTLDVGDSGAKCKACEKEHEPPEK